MDKRWEEIAHNIEKEMKKAVKYVDEQLVPATRKEANVFLKRAAKELEKLAEKLDDKK